MKTDVLYYGDNLGIMREHIPEASVDLVYLDPPFNSNRDYSLIFRDESGRTSDAQLLAFEDTWHWGPSAERTFGYLTNTVLHRGSVPSNVSQIIAALRAGLGSNEIMAYLVEMTVRLVELHRILKPTGSLYLHCDPTASHYLKLVLDAIFGPEMFRNEIVWRRTNAHNDAKRFGRIHDTILFYARSSAATWNRPIIPYNQKYIDTYYRYKDEDGRLWKSGDVTAPGGRGPRYEWKGHDRNWRFTRANMEKLDADGRLYYTPNGIPRLKQYLDEAAGMSAQDIWDDEAVRYLVSWSDEGLDYPTQKPVGLLERIIQASSNPGDIVLDPFCGCGTALVAAQKLERRWVGIDITYLSIAVMRARLKDAFGLAEVEVIGSPTEVEGARQLAESGPDGRYQFQWWALGLIDAKPIGGIEKKGPDKGIDGVITFTDKNGALERVLVNVKSGHVGAPVIQQFRGVLESEQASIGILLTLEEPTSAMRHEAAIAGDYHSDLWNRDYPKLQILSIADILMRGLKPELPPFVMPTYQQARKVTSQPSIDQQPLFGE